MNSLAAAVVGVAVILTGIGYVEFAINNAVAASNRADIHLSVGNQDLHSTRWPLIAMKTKTDPPFIISLPTQEEDSLRFEITQSGLYYERGLTRTVSEVLNAPKNIKLKKAAVLDVGCNLGWYTFYSASIFREQSKSSDRSIYCFEANPNIHPRLYDSIRFNRDFDQSITIVPNAVSDRRGSVTFSWLEGHYGGGSMKDGSNSDEPQQSTTVQTIPLDDYVATHIPRSTPILYLKLDVEGFECIVMRGARTLLTSRRVYNIFVEMGFDHEQGTGCTVKEYITMLLDEGGYKLRVGHDVNRPPIARGGVDAFLEEYRTKLSSTGGGNRYQNIWFFLDT